MNISQLNMKELVRDVREEEVVRMLKIVMENNWSCKKTLIILIKRDEEKRRRIKEERQREIRKRVYNER